jgi:hypothetical protein
MTGTLEIKTATSGAPADPDGYLLQLDGDGTRAVPIQAATLIGDLAPGEHAVELSGVAANCVVDGERRRTVSVAAGATARVPFQVVCTSSGAITVRVVTTGPRVDGNGYVVVVGDRPPRRTGLNEAVTIDGLEPGRYEVALGSNDAGCPVTDGLARTATVITAATSEIVYEIHCEAAAGAVLVVAETRGESPDEAYLIRVDGVLQASLGSRDSVTIDQLAVGVHEVLLDDVGANCALDGLPARSVNVANESLDRVRFEVTCITPGTGTLRVTLTTQVVSWPDFHGTFSVAVDQRAPVLIPANGSITIGSLSPGSHSVLLHHPGSCGVGGFFGPHTNPETVTIASGLTAALGFSVLCIG